MKTLLSIALLSSTLLASTPLFASAENQVGYTVTQAHVDHRPLPLNVHIWYPSQSDGKEIVVGANPIFVGHKIKAGSTPLKGIYPVMILSHGSGGNAANIGWYASSLAEQGIIVIAPNHSGTMSGDSTPKNTILTWQRPNDISDLIGNIKGLLPKGLNYDPAKIGVTGFSLGGYSVMALGGLQLSKQSYIDYCKRNAGLMDCAWMESTNLDLNTIQQDKYEANYVDPRVKLIVAIDPGFAAAFTQKSLKAIKTPTQIINLGDPKTLPEAVNSSNLVNEIEGAKYVSIKGASHFSFLGLCTKKAAKILKLEGEEPICNDPTSKSRASIHKEVSIAAIEYIKRQFSNSTAN